MYQNELQIALKYTMVQNWYCDGSKNAKCKWLNNRPTTTIATAVTNNSNAALSQYQRQLHLIRRKAKCMQ